MELVNIQFVPINASAYHSDLLAVMQSKRHPLLEELTAALTELWAVSGVSSICKNCFSGNLGRDPASHGCCGRCEHLGPKSCHAKPVMCAQFVCLPISNAEWVDVRIKKVVKSLYRHVSPLAKGYFSGGYKRELGPLTMYDKATHMETRDGVEHSLSCAIRMVKRYTAIFKAEPLRFTAAYKADLKKYTKPSS
jgi:hypothetical protein